MSVFNFLLFTTLLVTSSSTDIQDYSSSRIAAGVNAKAGENLDFVLLNVVFQNQGQICGSSLIMPRYVMTTATCVFDPLEGMAIVINVTFAQAKISTSKTKLFIHEMYNAATHENDIAIVQINRTMVPDGKTLAFANLHYDATVNRYNHQVMRFCGFGSISNYYTLPKNLICTDLYGQPTADCSSISNTICTYWEDRDNNVCASDYGGPLYASLNLGGPIITYTVGLASFSPNLNSATCTGRQKIVHTQIGAYINWITNITRNG